MKYLVTDPHSPYHGQQLEKEGDYWTSSKGVIGVTLKVDKGDYIDSIAFRFEQLLQVEPLTESQKLGYYHEQQLEQEEYYYTYGC